MSYKEEVENRIRVMQAWLNGKAAQYKMKNKPALAFEDSAPNPSFDSRFDWRIKPTKVEMYVGVYPVGTLTPVDSDPEWISKKYPNTKLVKLEGEY